MWKVLAERVTGSAHRRTGAVCQDYALVSQVRLADELVLVLVCSDGAGSAAFAQAGAQRTCERTLSLIDQWLRPAARLPEISSALVLDWLRSLRADLESESLRRQTDVRQFASTLLGAVVGESSAAFFQIGDGALVTRRGDDYEHVFWPRALEYANLTHCVTDPRPETVLDFLWCPRRIDELAVLTDGLQRLALDFKAGRAHGPFFRPMFEPLRACADPSSLAQPLRSFLESPQIEVRTDDDRTLVLATRVGDSVPIL